MQTHSLSTAGGALVALLLATQLAGAETNLNPTWIVQTDVGGFDLAQGISMAPDGSLYVAGTTRTGANQDIALLKLGAEGSEQWRRTYHATARDQSEAALADRDGVVIAGAVDSPLGKDAIVQRYDASGTHVWTQRFDKGTNEVGRDLAPAPEGGFYLAGSSTSTNGADGFLARFDAAGVELWARPINVFFMDEAFRVESDPQGNAYVAGRVVREGSFDPILRKYAPDGSVEWTRFLASDEHGEARGVAASAERACISGTAGAAATRQLDVLVACYAHDGTLLWEKTFDVTGADDEGRDAAFDASGNVILTGFGAFGESKSPFVLKVSPEGDELWRHVGANPGLAGTGALAVSPDGSRIVVAGAAQREGTDFDYLLLRLDQGSVRAAFRAPESAVRTGEPVAFEDASIGTGGALVGWTWAFGDGATSHDANPTHAFASPGAYVVRLVVQDAYGNLGVAERTVVVEGAAQEDDAGAATLERSPEADAPLAPDETSPRTPAPGVALVALAALLALGLRKRE